MTPDPPKTAPRDGRNVSHERLVTSLIALDNFIAQIRSSPRREDIIALTLRQLQTLVPFETVGFFFPRPSDATFQLQTPLEPEPAARLTELVEQAIDSGVFGWALHHYRPAAFKAADGQSILVLAALRTRQRLLGMFAAIPSPQFTSGWDANTIVLATYLACAADVILSEELTAELQQHNLKLEALVQERTGQLEGLLQRHQLFMRIAAHDLRNLLTVVNGFAQLGLACPEAEARATAFARIQGASMNMKGIIDEFLALQPPRPGRSA